MTSSGLGDHETAARYDETSAFVFTSEVLDPAVTFLAGLAGEGAALELAIGTGRGAVSLTRRGVSVSGIELSQAEQVACFRNAARHLVPGGRFVVELWVAGIRRLPLRLTGRVRPDGPARRGGP